VDGFGAASFLESGAHLAVVKQNAASGSRFASNHHRPPPFAALDAHAGRGPAGDDAARELGGERGEVVDAEVCGDLEWFGGDGPDGAGELPEGVDAESRVECRRLTVTTLAPRDRT
jgi:hypothetical protein